MKLAEEQAGGTPLYSGACPAKLRWCDALPKSNSPILVDPLRRTNFNVRLICCLLASGRSVRSSVHLSLSIMRSLTRNFFILFVAFAAAGAGCGGGGSTDPDGFTHKSGSLSSGDDTLTSGEFADDYSVSAQPGQWIEVVMTSAEFDPYVILKPPSCQPTGTCEQQIDNDDLRSGDTRAFVFYNANQAGSWEILATSSSPGEAGAYDLAYRVVDAGATPATAGIQTAASGLNAAGMLAAGDKTLNSGEYVDNYVFFSNAGQAVTIDLRSSEFDPYLILFGPDDWQEDNDDFEGDESHSQIVAALPSAGMYRVSATSYTSGETGAYTLNMSGGGDAPAANSGGGEVIPFEKN